MNEGSRKAITVGNLGDKTDHIRHGCNKFLPRGFPNLMESGQRNIISPLDNPVIIDRILIQGHKSLSDGVDKS